jgi:hypothetical protein
MCQRACFCVPDAGAFKGKEKRTGRPWRAR